MTHDPRTYDITPFLQAIGRLVITFNGLDSSLRLLARLLVYPDDDHAANIVVSTIATNQVEDLLRLLGPHRLSPGASSDLTKIINEVSALRARRNDIVHGVLRIPNESTDLEDAEYAKFGKRGRPDTRVTSPWAPKEIVDAANEASRLSDEVTHFISLIRAVDGIEELLANE